MMNVSRQIKGMTLSVINRVLPVKPLEWNNEKRSIIDRESRRMQLYFCRRCPSSVQVQRSCERLGLHMVEKDVGRVNSYRNELVNGGGQPRVPCLRLDLDNKTTWLYGQREIVSYLEGRYCQ